MTASTTITLYPVSQVLIYITVTGDWCHTCTYVMKSEKLRPNQFYQSGVIFVNQWVRDRQ